VAREDRVTTDVELSEREIDTLLGAAAAFIPR